MTALTETSPQAKFAATPRVHSPAGSKAAQPTMVASTPQQDTSAEHSAPRAATPVSVPMEVPPPGGLLALIEDAVEADPAFLALAADLVDDLERVRIANENRLRHLTRGRADSDGEIRGLGLDARHPYVRRFEHVVNALRVAEHESVLGLQSLMRKHPLGPWVKSTVGVGEKQAARLLAVIGDPYWHSLHDRPRRVSELWAFCGYHVLPARQPRADDHRPFAGGNKTGHPDQFASEAHRRSVGVAPKRQRGQRANWSTVAKTRTYLIAESCIKQRTSPFRAVYDAARVKYADAVHSVGCVRCGPKGQLAAVGSPLSDGHKHARAMRATSKAVLKELWRESERIHEETSR